MSVNDLSATLLLETPTLSVRDVVCGGQCRHQSPEECASVAFLVFPYRGVFVRHLGRDAAVADPNRVVFFNADEGYRISHPVEGGDACLSLGLNAETLLEIAPPSRLRAPGQPAFERQSLGIDPISQTLVARLRRGLSNADADPLEFETLVLTLVDQALGGRAPEASPGRRKLVDRARLVLAGDPGRRWTLAEIAGAVGVSPVYLTQVFQQVEGVPLYRYQLRLRLSRALDLLGRYRDLAALALELGFSSQSHFGAAFRKAYGYTPAEFQREARL